MKKLFTILFLILVTANCGGGGGSGGDGSNTGYLSLQLVQNQEFNPNVTQGEVTQYRVSITGDTLAAPIIKYYEAGTTSASLDGFPNGTVIDILVEYLNANNVVVRRGRTTGFVIHGGQMASATLQINNVPIFANVDDGAQVYANRFVPQIFAPGGIEFEIVEQVDGSENILPDISTSEVSFSISADDTSSLRTVHIATLAPGQHTLMVKDPDSGESSTVQITVLESATRKAFNTTAGAYVGSLLTTQGSQTNLIDYLERTKE